MREGIAHRKSARARGKHVELREAYELDLNSGFNRAQLARSATERDAREVRRYIMQI